MKDSFIKLLRARFDAEGDEEIQLSEKILNENGLSQSTFWEAVCPSLEKEGLLKYYNDPNSTLLSEYDLFVFNNQEYKNKSKILAVLTEIKNNGIPTYNGHSYIAPEVNECKGKSVEEKIENIKADINNITSGIRKAFIHKFIINKEKLSHWKMENKKGDSLFVFQLTKSGVLTRKDPVGKDKPYKMEAGKLRHHILQELMKAQSKSDNFYDTKSLAEILNVGAGQIRKAVAGMKTRMVNMFNGIHKDDFIESSKNSGYRLHKQIRIIKI